MYNSASLKIRNTGKDYHSKMVCLKLYYFHRNNRRHEADAIAEDDAEVATKLIFQPTIRTSLIEEQSDEENEDGKIEHESRNVEVYIGYTNQNSLKLRLDLIR